MRLAGKPSTGEGPWGHSMAVGGVFDAEASLATGLLPGTCEERHHSASAPGFWPGGLSFFSV